MKLNKYSKIIFVFGSILISLSVTLSAVCAILAGRYGNYYLLMGYSSDFLVLMRQYIALTAIGVILTQFISQKYNETE